MTSSIVCLPSFNSFFPYYIILYTLYLIIKLILLLYFLFVFNHRSVSWFSSVWYDYINNDMSNGLYITVLLWRVFLYNGGHLYHWKKIANNYVIIFIFIWVLNYDGSIFSYSRQQKLSHMKDYITYWSTVLKWFYVIIIANKYIGKLFLKYC